MDVREPDRAPDARRGEGVLADVLLAIAACAVAPIALGGLWMRGWHGPRRDALISLLARWSRVPLKRINHSTDPAQLHEGIELAGTIGRGQLTRRAGLLAEIEGGILLLAMAERASKGLLGPLAMAIDEARLGLVVLDEALPDEQGLDPALAERLSLAIDLRDETALWPIAPPLEGWPEARALESRLEAARCNWPEVRLDRGALREILKACLALGIGSMRAPLLAATFARVSAALHGRASVEVDDLGFAVRLCLLPRARQMPVASASESEDPSESEASDEAVDETEPHEAEPAPEPAGPPEPPVSADPDTSLAPDDTPEKPADEHQPIPDGSSDRLIEAALASLPSGVLALLAGAVAANAGRGQGVSGSGLQGSRGRGRGRPVGSVRRAPRSGERLHLLATIRAAVPFQPLRRRQLVQRASAAADLDSPRSDPAAGLAPGRLHLRPDDLHVHREKRRRGNTTVFVVDASGSMALQRLAEAKGAVEVLLAECYVRRDRVALVSFRGKGADLLLPPTRSLVAARRSLTALPGGGGSPVASGLELAARLVAQVRRAGDSATVVLLTDGRANLTRAGLPGRQQAGEEAREVARQLAGLADRRLLIDTSVRPDPAARALAVALHGTYLPMPFAQARAIGEVVARAASTRAVVQ